MCWGNQCRMWLNIWWISFMHYRKSLQCLFKSTCWKFWTCNACWCINACHSNQLDIQENSWHSSHSGSWPLVKRPAHSHFTLSHNGLLYQDVWRLLSLHVALTFTSLITNWHAPNKPILEEIKILHFSLVFMHSSY